MTGLTGVTGLAIPIFTKSHLIPDLCLSTVGWSPGRRDSPQGDGGPAGTVVDSVTYLRRAVVAWSPGCGSRPVHDGHLKKKRTPNHGDESLGRPWAAVLDTHP